MSKKFPDLTGDGKVTQADILKGRKVFADGGSLMVPVERKMYGKGRLVTSAMKMIKEAFESGNISEDAIKKADKIHFELEANDFAGTGRTTEKGKREMVAQEQGVTVDEVDIIETAFARASGGGESKSLIEELKMVGRALTTEPTRAQQRAATLGGTKETRESRIKAGKFGAAGAGVGSLLTGSAMSAWNMLNDEPPATKKEASDFEKAFSSAFKTGKETFMFDGEEYTTKLKRQAKGKGGIIVDLMASILGKKATAKKLDMADKAKVADAVQEELDINPNFLDELEDDEFDYLMARMPQEEQAMLGAAEAPVDDMVEMMRGINPKEAAQQLELFGSERNIYEYADSLKPQDLREFVGNVKKEDYEIFGNFNNFLERLGPRQMKAHGGAIGLLIPVEGMKPDAEMEEDYVSYVMDETLSDDEMEYVNKALEADNRLSELFDKIVLSSAEFTGSGEVDGPGTGTSDEIPARLSDGEFVFTKKAVDVIGVEKLEEMMKDAEEQAERQNKAVGGLMDDPTQDEKANLPDQAMSDEQIEEQMLDANRIPSLMRR